MPAKEYSGAFYYILKFITIMNVKTLIIGLATGLLIGFLVQFLINKTALKAKHQRIIDDAHKEAEVIKKNKLLEVKEKFLNICPRYCRSIFHGHGKTQSEAVFWFLDWSVILW